MYLDLDMLPLQFFLPKSKPFIADPLAPLGISFDKGMDCDLKHCEGILRNMKLESDLTAFKSRLPIHPLIGAVDLAQPVSAPVAAASPVAPAVRMTRRASVSAQSLQGDDMSDEVDGSEMLDDGYPESLIDGSVRYVDEFSDDVSLDAPPRR